MRVAVFGATGMLGSAVSAELKKFGFDVVTIGREGCDIKFSVGQSQLRDLDLHDVSYMINCIGLISHVLDESNALSRSQAISINALFPHELSVFAEMQKAKVIQIATDCVFSGSARNYTESSTHDATDLYGKTKSMGEVRASNFMNLRTSIIGRESRGFHSLLEWVVRQPNNSQLNGFIDRQWNGITTLAFARIVAGILDKGLFRQGLQHIIPKNTLSKSELVRLIAAEFGREDLVVSEVMSGYPKNLTLATDDPQFNKTLWLAANYFEIPSIQDLVREISL